MGRRSFLDEEEYGRWRQEVDRALAAARVSAEAGVHNWACFGAEQAAKLGMKALLHGVGRGPWGHDLPRFGNMAGEAGIKASGEMIDAMRRLGRHYIPARYPDAHAAGPPGSHHGEADEDEALRDSRRILAIVR